MTRTIYKGVIWALLTGILAVSLGCNRNKEEPPSAKDMPAEPVPAPKSPVTPPPTGS